MSYMHFTFSISDSTLTEMFGRAVCNMLISDILGLSVRLSMRKGYSWKFSGMTHTGYEQKLIGSVPRSHAEIPEEFRESQLSAGSIARGRFCEVLC